MFIGLALGLGVLPPASTSTDPTPPLPSLQPYYDSGAIPIHLSSDGAALDGSGNVVGLTNQGAAGTAFNASIVGSAVPIINDCLQLTESNGFPQLAGFADLVGVRMLWVMQPAISTEVTVFGGGSNSVIALKDSGALGMRDRSSGTWGPEIILPGPARSASLRLFEVELTATTARFFVDGVLSSAAANAYPAFPLDRIGRRWNVGSLFVGLMGDAISVLSGHPDTDAAIADVRVYLNGRFQLGLTL